MLGVPDCVADCIRLAVPQATEWQRIGDEIDAAMILTRSDFVNVPVKRAVRLRQRHGIIVKGKRTSCPPHHDYEHGFPLIRSLRASTQRSTLVLFSFVLSLLIVAGSFALWQSKTTLARFCEAGERSGLLTHIATDGKRFVVRADEK